MNKLFNKMLYINENSNPRSLQNNIKYYYKRYGINEGSYNINFSFTKLLSNKYLMSFKTKKIDSNLIIEFLTTLSKLYSIYLQKDLSGTEYDIIIQAYQFQGMVQKMYP